MTMAMALAAAATVLAQAGGDQPQGTPPTPPPDEPRVARLKSEAAADIDSMKVFTQQMVDSVFSFGELGFQELETNRYLIDILKKNGFTVEEGIAGIPTAFMATWGSGTPVLALGSDIDGIPQASQKPGVAYHDPIIEGAPGHGEGHNSGEPLNITAAIAVKKIMQREKLPGTILVRHGGGAGRDEGLFRSRRLVQGRRRRPVCPRRRRHGRHLGRPRFGNRSRLGALFV
jgi:hypothetical protein